MIHSRKISAVLNQFQTWLAIGLVPMLSSCALQSRQAVLQATTQFPADSDGNNLKTRGFLIAYTPEELHFDNKGSRFYRHTGYYISRGNDDQLGRYIPNYLGKTNEAATVLNLPAGPYRINTQTAHGYPVTIAIVIRPGVTTTINLEDGRKPPLLWPANFMVCVSTAEMSAGSMTLRERGLANIRPNSFIVAGNFMKRAPL